MTGNKSSDGTRLMSLSEVARYLRRSTSTTKRLADSGKLIAARTTLAGHKRFDRETVDKLAAVLASNMKTSEVAAKFGVSRNTVERWAKKKILPSQEVNPGKRLHRHFTQEAVEAFAASLNEGMSKMEVARFLGLSSWTLSTWIRHKRLRSINGDTGNHARFSREEVKALGATFNAGITAKQVAPILKVSIATARDLGKCGTLRCWRTPSGLIRFDEKAVEAYAKTRRTGEVKK